MMNDEEVYFIVTRLPANSNDPLKGGPLQGRKLHAFADALDKLVTGSRTNGFNVYLGHLRTGHCCAGRAALHAMASGADPQVVLATARLILS